MTNPKDILVTTTSTLEGLQIKQYLKPISAHIVAGTNLFSDFFASFSDVFGGRSQTYQKQLTSLYNEAIEKLKLTAYEIGANCIVGFNIDMDEISGKGKSMFMLTAMGTAVIIDDLTFKKVSPISVEKLENVSIDRIKILQRKREIQAKATEGVLKLDDEIWDFIIANQVVEVYDFILKQLRKCITSTSDIDNPFTKYYKQTIVFLDALPQDQKTNLLYTSILKEDTESLAIKLCEIAKELQLLDFNFIDQILQVEDFQKQKRGLMILTYDKPFYNKEDVEKLNSLINIINTKFPERGIRSMKKQLLSSKEKEIWTCECKGTSEIGKLCGSCNKDIYGFKATEISPNEAISEIEEKISLIEEYM